MVDGGCGLCLVETQLGNDTSAELAGELRPWQLWRVWAGERIERIGHRSSPSLTVVSVS